MQSAGSGSKREKSNPAVGHAQKTPLKGKRFESLEEAQAYLDHWEEHWADTRIHGRTKRQVAAMFAEEKPSLQVLAAGAVPLLPVRKANGPYRWLRRSRSGLLWCSAGLDRPPGRCAVGRDVRAPARSAHRLCCCANIWDRSAARHRIRDEDRPRRTPPHTLRLLARAHKAGPNIGAVCDAIHHRQAEAGVRRIMGVLSLAKKYGCAAVGSGLRRGAGAGCEPSIASCAGIWSAARRRR